MGFIGWYCGIDKSYHQDVWLSTGLETANWSEGKKTWTLKVRRHGEEKTITCRHIVFAIGQVSAVPSMPNYPNRVWRQ